jgi:hypothetical protein
MVEGIKIEKQQRATVEVIMADGTVMSGLRHTPIGDL